MTSVLVFWVLMTFDTGTKQLHSQQFVSESACQEALAFVEQARGTYIMAKCLRDQARRGGPELHKQELVRP
jgi:hypothetical protein